MIFKLLPEKELEKICDFSKHIYKISNEGTFVVVAECVLKTKRGPVEAYIGKSRVESLSHMGIVENKGFVSYEGKRLRHYEENANDYALIRKQFGTLLTDNAQSATLLKRLGDD